MTRQTHTDDTERAVSEVLGSILVFALVIAVLAILQTTLVPTENAQVEADHSQAVQSDMQDLDAAIAKAVATDDAQVTRVALGTDYPNRFLLLNPPSARGSFAVEERGNVTLTNATASGEAGDYLDGGLLNFSTSAVVYTPDYNVFGPAPTTVVATGAVFNRFTNQSGPDTYLTLGGDLVNGRTVSFTAIEGNVSGGGLSTQVPVRPVSAPVQTVTVTDDGSPITITVPTELPAEKWEALLADEMGPGGHVTDVRDGPGESVVVELEQGVSYDLRIGRAVVGTGNATAEPTYLTVEGSSEMDVPELGQRTFTVQVRDRYNNPVSGVTVNATAELGPGSVTPVDDSTTDAAGRVTFRYEYGADLDGTASVRDDLNVSFTVDPAAGSPSFDADAPENATLEVVVQNIDRSGLGNVNQIPLNPSGPGSVYITGVDYSNNDVTVTFRNNNATRVRNWSEARVSFYGSTQNLGGGTTYDDLWSEINDNPQDRLVPLHDYEDVDEDVSFDPNQEEDVTFSFNSNIGQQGGDFFVLQVRYENGQRTIYFIGIPKSGTGGNGNGNPSN